MHENNVIVRFGTTDLSGKGPGSYSGGVFKLGKNYSVDVLLSAMQFNATAKICLNNNKIEGDKPIYIVPGVVCAAFSCELSLKWLIFRSSGSGVKGHQLDDLYGKLEAKDRDNIRRFTQDFDQFMSRNMNIFIDARYHHEVSIFAFREQKFLRFSDYLLSYIEIECHDAINE